MESNSDNESNSNSDNENCERDTKKRKLCDRSIETNKTNYVDNTEEISQTADKNFKLTLPGLYCFYGYAYSGKTSYMKQLLCHALHRKEFEKVYLFTSLGPTHNEWKSVMNKIPDFCITIGYLPDILNLVNMKANSRNTVPTLIIIDDELIGQNYNISLLYQSVDIALKHNISVWMIQQYYETLDIEFRRKAVMSFMFTASMIRKFHNELLYPTKILKSEEQEKFIDEVREGKRIICIRKYDNDFWYMTKLEKYHNDPICAGYLC